MHGDAVAATSTTAAAAPSGGERDRSLGAPEGEDDERDLEPLEEDALEGEREAVAVEAGALSRAPRLVRSASSRAKIASSSWSALNPLARRIAFRSHCRPKTSRKAPTTSRRASSGITVNAGPEGGDDRRQGDDRGSDPASEERQPRARPAASTIVSASTISTALARNAERTRKTALIESLRIPRSDLTGERVFV